MGKTLKKKQHREQKQKLLSKPTKKSVNKTLNYTALVLAVSMFNALFYYFGLGVVHALAIFFILFALTLLAFTIFKILNRKKRKWKSLES